MKDSTKYKIKIILITIGVTLAAYLVIKFLLPLVTPFIFAGIISLLLLRPINFLCRKCNMNRSFATVLVMVCAVALLGTLIFVIVRVATAQFKSLMKGIGDYLYGIGDWCSDNMCRLDRTLGMTPGTCEKFLTGRLGGGKINSGIIGSVGLIFTGAAFMIMATFFFCRDYFKIKKGIEKSPLAKEFQYITVRSRKVFGVYIKTQSIIMAITALICSVGLWVMGNKYALLLGVIIGFMDALPVIGTGTFFVPWAAILMINREYKSAAGILAIYLVCYYVREFLEPKLMSDKLMISPVAMLIALYVGLILFGISGVITGPVAAVLIKEIVQLFMEKNKQPREP